MNWFEKIRDNFIPIERLYNKFFYSDKVASLLLRIPVQEINQETSLVFLLQKGFSKYKLLKLYQKQVKLELYITKKMDMFRVYDPNSRKYVQLIKIGFGVGIEYLLLGEILERDFKFKFNYSAQQVLEDKGYALCISIEQVMNRIGDYFRDKDPRILNSIKDMIKKEQLMKKLEESE